MVGSDDMARSRALLASLQAPPPEVLDAPLDYIFADHARQRILFGILHDIATARQVTLETALAIRGFLTKDLPLHHADEDEDLFPRVQKRAEPEDCLEPLLARLMIDHDQSTQLVKTIRTALGRHVGENMIRISPRSATAMLTYAEREHRHLSIENNIVLVIARKRLQTTDLVAMTQSMRARRFKV